jgi:hypothetical protein
MPPYEVMMSHHPHDDHHLHHDSTSHELLNSVIADDYDDRLVRTAVSTSTDDDIDDFNDETETSEGDENQNNDSPTEARMVNGEDWNHITKPGLHDVLLGRGGGTNNHSGNVKFRKLVNEHKMRYLACSKVEKPKVARQVVILWRKLDPPGRFLARKDETKRGPGSVKASDNVWYEVGDKKAREKASQCLRERTPDVLPYIKHLREQQNAITEQGVSMVQMQMQQREQQQQVHISPQRGANNHNLNMMSHNMSSPPSSGNMHVHPNTAYSNPNFDGAMPTPVRRTSINMIPPSSTPSNAHYSPSHPQNNNFQLHHHHQQQQQAFQNQRRASLPSMNGLNGAPMFDMGYDHVSDDLHGSDYPEMSDMEYQHQMMLMQQQMMQQQLQMQRLQQTRAMRAAAAGGQHFHSPARATMGSALNNPLHNVPQPSLYNDVSPTNPATRSPSAFPAENVGSKPKRGREEGKSVPDRTTSLMSLTPAYPDDHELSLEDYRQQLEEYVANCNKDDPANQSSAFLAEDGNESDLEDDWEKERERAVRQAQAHKKEMHNRGVNRNASGISAMSGLLSTKSNVSMISGFSGFSDLSKDNNNTTGKTEREQKMNMARSVGSNISLMSELTDLSQNIDNLSIYDD